MKKTVITTLMVVSTLLFLSCGQSKQDNNKADEAKVSKDLYIQLYSVRDDIKSDFKGTITKVAEAGYKGEIGRAHV